MCKQPDTNVRSILALHTRTPSETANNESVCKICTCCFEATLRYYYVVRFFIISPTQDFYTCMRISALKNCLLGTMSANSEMRALFAVQSPKFNDSPSCELGCN